MIWIGLAAVVAAATGVGYFVLQGRGGGGGVIPDVAVQSVDTMNAVADSMAGDTMSMGMDSLAARAESTFVAVAPARDTATTIAAARITMKRVTFFM